MVLPADRQHDPVAGPGDHRPESGRHLNRAAIIERAALLAQPTYIFSELFHTVYARMKARKIPNLAEDMLRLRSQLTA